MPLADVRKQRPLYCGYWTSVQLSACPGHQEGSDSTNRWQEKSGRRGLLACLRGCVAADRSWRSHFFPAASLHGPLAATFPLVTLPCQGVRVACGRCLPSPVKGLG